MLILRNRRLITRGTTHGISLLSKNIKSANLLHRTLIRRLLSNFSKLIMQRLQVKTIRMRRIGNIRTRHRYTLLTTAGRILQTAIRVPHKTTINRITRITRLNNRRRLILQPLPNLGNLTRRLFANLFFTTKTMMNPDNISITTTNIRQNVRNFSTSLITTVIFSNRQRFTITSNNNKRQSRIARRYRNSSLRRW